MKEPIVIIPARRQSSRYPSKPFARIRGVSGEVKTLIQRTWEVGVASGLRTVIATDDAELADLAVGFGAEVQMTTNAANGTERCAMAATSMGLRPEDVVINLQGDACLTPPEWLAELKDRMVEEVHGEEGVLTMVADIQRDDLPAGDVLAFADIYGTAYHFARFKGGFVPNSFDGHFLHFGVYAYTVKALREYLPCGVTAPELTDGLEQLRWGRLGIPVRLVWAPRTVRLPECEVNYPGDVSRVEQALAKWGIE